MKKTLIIDNDINELLLKVHKNLATLNTMSEYISDIDLFLYAYVYEEALESSKIEGTMCTMEDIFSNINNDLSDLDIDNADILTYISNENYEEVFDGIFGFNFESIVKIANIAKPKTFYDLFKIISFAHGDGVWANNAEILLKDSKITLEESISNRDDIFDILVKHDISIEESYHIMENVRKGKGNIYSEQYLELFEKHNLPKWFLTSLTKIKYLFPRAHVISFMLLAWKLLWFKIHNREEFNDVLEKSKNA